MADLNYLPEFSYEILVGSHPEDDLEVNSVRWVTQFCQDLHNSIRMRFVGGDVELRFHRLGQNDGSQSDRERRDSILRRSATLVAILGRKSVEPAADYGEHWSRFAETLGSGDTRTRLFKAHKAGSECSQSQEEGAGYIFWERDPDTDQPFEFLYNGSQEAKTKHTKTVFRLAADLNSTLMSLKNMADERPRVYLTGNSPELHSFYEEVLVFLSSWCQVSTEPPIDPTDPGYERAVRAEMEKCALSVHLLGNGPPPAVGNDAASLQMKTAQALVESYRLATIVWAPQELYANNGKMTVGPLREFRENWETLSNETMPGLRARIRARLSQPLPEGEKTRVFLIVHQTDRPLTEALLRDLRGSSDSYHVELSPDFDPRKFRIDDYRNDLNQSDAAIICWAGAPLSWFTRMQDALLAHLGQSCNMSLRRCAVSFSGLKASFWTPFERIACDSFEASQIEAFLEGLRARKGKAQPQ